MTHNGDTASEIAAEISSWIQGAFNDSFSMYILASAAILVFLIGTCILAAVISTNSAYVNKDTAPKKFHYAFLFCTAFNTASLWFASDKQYNMLFFISASIFAAVSVWGLSRYKVYGLVCSLLHIWTMFLAYQIDIINVANKERLEVNGFTVAGKVTVYAYYHYYLQQAVILSLILLVFSVLVIVYYTRRRYLFAGYKTAAFYNLPACPHCGMPVVREAAHCTNCGKKAETAPVIPWFKVLSIERYCADCGALLIKGKCYTCKRVKADRNFFRMFIGTKKDAANKAVTFLQHTAKAFLAGFGFVMFLLPGSWLSTASFDKLTADYEEVTNAYIEKLNEHYDNPSLSEDSGWLLSFDSANDALYTVNRRCFFVHPENMRHSDIVFYAQYAEACYKQMSIMEQIRQNIHQSSTAGMDEMADVFEDTLIEKRDAFAGYGYVVTDSLVIENLRFYFALFNNYTFWRILLFLGIGEAIFVLARYNSLGITRVELFIERIILKASVLSGKNIPLYSPPKDTTGIGARLKSIYKSGILGHLIRAVAGILCFILLILGMLFLLISIFRPGNLGRVIKRFMPPKYKKTEASNPGQYTVYKKGRRKEVRLNIIAYLLSISFLFFISFVPDLTAPDYSESVYDIIVSSPGVFLTHRMDLSGFETAAMYSEENVDDVLSYINAYLQAINTVQSLLNIPSEYVMFHEGLLSLCEQEKRYLVRFKELLMAGERLPLNEIRDLIELREKNYYGWVIQNYSNLQIKKGAENVTEIIE